MRRTLQIFIFWLTAFLEVEIHARVIQYPAHCTKGVGDCTLRAHEKLEWVDLPGLQVRLAKNAVVHRTSAKLSVLSGEVCLNAALAQTVVEGPLKVDMVPGAVLCLVREPSKDSVQILQIQGSSEVHWFNKSVAVITAGFWTWLRPSQPLNEGPVEVPQAITPTVLLNSSFVALLGRDFQETRTVVRDLASQMPKNAEVAYDLAYEGSLSLVREHQARLREAQRLRAAKMSEERQLRSLFRSKTLYE